MMNLVSRENVTDLFEKMVPGLERTLTKTSLGKYWTLDALYHSLINKVAFGFYQEESGYSGAFTIVNSPLRKTLNVFWAGKDMKNKTPINDEECDAFFRACAELFECESIMIKGRKGWEKRVGSRGYHEDSRVYIKEV